jgi:preprotein translocase subunit SecE
LQNQQSQIQKSTMNYRGVSSTVKLSVSKTELGGSNPSAPARVLVSGRNKGKAGSQMSIATQQNGLATTIKAWPERTRTFYNDVRTEMKKVTAPSFKEVRATTGVVIVTVFLFGVYFWAVDNTIGTGINYLFKYMVHR